MNLFSNALVGQLIVLLFLLAVSLRTLFKKSKNMESVAFLSVIALLLHILLIFIFGISVLSLIILGFCIIVLLTNATSIYRLVQKLYSDGHSTAFCAISYIEAFLLVVCIVFVFIFKPISYNTDLIKTEIYTGSFSRGFVQKTEILEQTNIIVQEYSLANLDFYSSVPTKTEKETAVVYVSPIGVSAADSALRLTAAAEMGLTILTGDFFANDVPNTRTILDKPISRTVVLNSFVIHFLDDFDTNQKEALLEQKALELDVLLSIAKEKYSSVIIVAEGENVFLAQEAHKRDTNFVKGVFSNTQDDSLDVYYGREIADFALLNPLDALLSKFDTREEFNIFKEYGENEIAHLRYAKVLVENVNTLIREGQYDLN